MVVLLELSIINTGRDDRDNIALPENGGNESPISLIVAGEKLTVPANMIRFPSVRGGGTVESLDLLLHWPSLEGYSKERAEAFGDEEDLA